MNEQVKFTINGLEVSVPKGTTVYQAVKEQGIDLPIFCYHDRMPPFGACRVCLVEVEKMGKLQTSCTLVATEGMAVNTESSRAVDGRKSILELLLINHPLDCPICDRGGECPLQEQTLKFGPGLSRFFEEKRQFTKALPVGPVLMLDRERCIVCARCTRFGSEIAGDHALEMLDRGYKSEVGPADGKTLDSKFIGNTIMICPVGALTSQVYRFRARPWDNQPTESSCTLCPVGCSLYLDSRDGQIMRTRSRENQELNDIWLCDKGWFGYEFAMSPDRLQKPLIRKNGALTDVSWDEALHFVAEKMVKAKGKAGAIGGNPLTVEENYLFQAIIREGAKSNNLDHRAVGPFFTLAEEGAAAGMHIKAAEIEQLKSVYLLGLDLTEEFPVFWLHLKKAIDKGCKVVYLGHYTLEIARYLNSTLLHSPGAEIEFIQKYVKDPDGTVFIGRQYLNTHKRKEILDQLSTFGNRLQIMEGNGNSLGARYAGMHPELGPKGAQLSSPGMNTLQMLESAAAGGLEFLYIAGADVAEKFPSTVWQKAREKLGCLVVQDIFLTKTAACADVVLPTLCFVEKGGIFLNIGRNLEKLQPGKEIPSSLFSDGEIFSRLSDILGLSIAPFQIENADIQTDHKYANAKTTSETPSKLVSKIVLRASFAPSLFDQGVRMQKSPHVTKLSKPPVARLHPDEALKYGIKDQDKIHIDGKVTLTAQLDEGVAMGTLVLPLGFPKISLHELSSVLYNGLEIGSIKVEASHDR